jgi:hypothetical protein
MSTITSLRFSKFSRRIEHSFVCASMTGFSFSSVSFSSNAARTPPTSCLDVTCAGKGVPRVGLSDSCRTGRNGALS